MKLINDRRIPMNIAELLDNLKMEASENQELRAKLLATRNAPNPMSAFCEECRRLGYPIYEMELIDAGEEFYAAIKRSTNGGGENSPVLKGEDDFYEMFFAEL